nr:hypothetical protein [uncultured Eisenbergiella sp.]
MGKIRNALTHSFVRYFIYAISILFVIIMVLIPAVNYYEIHTRSRLILMDTKNIQLAMRLLSIQYYGQDRNIYQPGEPYGMAEDTIKEIKQLSGAEGEITLVYWNTSKGLPGKFFYQTDSFLAVYEYDDKRDEPEWNIYRLKEVVALGKE